MCHSRELNIRINKLHERALRLVYKEKNLIFEQLLEKDNAFTIHERNLVPEDIKEAKSLAEFKAKIRDWKPSKCDCRLCKAYIKGVGYGIFKDGAFV